MLNISTNGDTSTIKVPEGDTRIDAMGDLPNWDSLSFQEIVKLCYYWKKDTNGKWIPRPCEWKDGNSKIDYNKLNSGDDLMTTALRRMAATQKSLLKCGLTDEIINSIKPEMDLDEACNLALKEKRAAFVLDCDTRRKELKQLKKEANLIMSEFRSTISMKELCDRLQKFSVAVRDAPNKSYEYRVQFANKAVTQACLLSGIQEKKEFNTFINRYYWAMVTGKLVSNPEAEAEKRFTATEALKGCMTRYLEALKDHSRAVDSDNHRTEPMI
jgi:hypothetical protein